MQKEREREMIVDKPWGHEEKWADVSGLYTAKMLRINSGHRLSLQYHERKTETIMVLEGELIAQIGDVTSSYEPGSRIHVEPGTVHRFGAGDDDVTLVEVSTWDDGDVVRIEDDYDRG
jgi:quercetin dioxygenase-like cupin family protein